MLFIDVSVNDNIYLLTVKNNLLSYGKFLYFFYTEKNHNKQQY